ncbi:MULTISPECIES: LysR family transcriptional regulator [Providencia]|uniref:LysR family transcriptional regulator n=1 Tax=Providencia TaxID=586 RepID=UPI0016566B36|nr:MULTISPECIES: LysR family transcriptional regulator [Providencia]MBC8653156.1 LysR family transcriptional regulator [Providencia vermicola]EIU7558897.1 LysR family transcriptional regulator [Providencia rettgeri]MBQ0436783.1 LysR family transcriptional regulator [Providencia rettgeri]MCB4842625.1 LysR family transcriptional regulator [Providencia rettgeri]MCG5276713.1 LysR family transcriptional regulator [Providencia rettgeri]
MKLDPRLVVQFAIIAEEGSFTRAAERLHVAQPWLSARLKKFEEQLGFPLFTRNTRNIALTKQGYELLQAARGVHASMMLTEALASQLQHRDERHLRLGSPPYGNHIVRRQELVDQFALIYPDISVELDIGWSSGLIDRVLKGGLDLAFVLGEVHHSEIETMLLCELKLELLMSANHPLAKVNNLKPADLKGQTIAVFTRALHPELFDSIFTGLKAAGATLVQFIEFNQALLDRTHSAEPTMVASFGLRYEYLNAANIIGKTLDESNSIPFSLIRKIGHASEESQLFWDLSL